MQTLNATSDPEGSQHLTPSRFIWGLALVAELLPIARYLDAVHGGQAHVEAVERVVQDAQHVVDAFGIAHNRGAARSMQFFYLQIP